MAEASAVARAAGILFLTRDGRVLLCRRVDDGHFWSFPGGGIEAGETSEVAARREAQEEAGIAAAELTPWTRRVKDGVDFTTFLARVPDSFTPTLNHEHDQFQWLTPDEALDMGGLHPGAYIALLRLGMDEGDIARAMAIEELTSPQRYENLMLLAVRVTGTGASYRSHAGRKELDAAGNEVKDKDGKPVYAGEYVWRDPKLYLNDGFLQRCQGLPVVMDHPPDDKDVIDTEYFRDWVVGTLMLPYIRGNEVWSIARIYDQAAAALIETEQLSTSPGVLVGGKRVPAGDGRDIFVEGKPSLLDHLAICVLGVWDKGGPAAGISNQSPVGDTTMADKTNEEKILDGIEKMHSRMDGYEEAAKKDRVRMDGIEATQKDSAKKDEDEEAKAKKDAEEKAAKDAEETAAKAAKDKKDAEDEQAKKDSAAGDFKVRLDALEGRMKEPTAEERKAFTAAQLRAEPLYHAFGDSAGAPRQLQGEGILSYRKRLVGAFKDKSKAWKDVNLDAITDETVLANVEAAVFKDAMDVAKSPIQDIGSGQLRMIVTPDDAGRKIRTFVGDTEGFLGPFKHRAKLVTSINDKSAR